MDGPYRTGWGVNRFTQQAVFAGMHPQVYRARCRCHHVVYRRGLISFADCKTGVPHIVSVAERVGS